MVVARHKRVYHHWYDKIRLFICGHQVTYLHTTFLCASTRSKRKKRGTTFGHWKLYWAILCHSFSFIQCKLKFWSEEYCSIGLLFRVGYCLVEQRFPGNLRLLGWPLNFRSGISFQLRPFGIGIAWPVNSQRGAIAKPSAFFFFREPHN